MMCLEVVNLSDWERVEESLGNQKLQTSLASKEMVRVGYTVTTLHISTYRLCTLKLKILMGCL